MVDACKHLVWLGCFPPGCQQHMIVLTLSSARRTGREHRVHILPLTALCSVRRWERKGVSTVSVTNQAMLLLHIYAGVSPNTLYRLYYGRSVR